MGGRNESVEHGSTGRKQGQRSKVNSRGHEKMRNGITEGKRKKIGKWNKGKREWK